MFKFPTKASLDSYIAGTTPKSGIHTVEVDETHYNEKIEYVYKNSILTRLSNPKIEFIKRNNVNTFAEVASITSPINKNMVVVLKDETTFSKTTWYTYNVSQWVLMGEYLGSKIEKVVSIDGDRTSVIHENTNFTIPGTLKYTVGRNEISIYVGGIKLSSTDFIEIGTTGVLSNIVQFTSAILTGMEIEFIREVHNNVTIDPSYQIVQQKIHDETLEDQRMHIVSARGYNYGGTIQACRNQDPTKVYWCNVNKKFYYPKPVSIVPAMTAPTSGTITVSASSTHGAPFLAWYTFDTKDNTFWHNVDDGSPISPSNTEWIQIDFGKVTPISHILFTPRSEFDWQFPKTYDILGSLDGTTWTTIKSVVNNIKPYNHSILKKGYTINECSGNYRYYRIVIKDTNWHSSFNAIDKGMVSIAGITILDNTDSKSWNIADSDWTEFDIFKKKIVGISINNISTINIPAEYVNLWTKAHAQIIRKVIGWTSNAVIVRGCPENMHASYLGNMNAIANTPVCVLADCSAIYINLGLATYQDTVFSGVFLELD
jgi:ribosomal protein S17